VKVYYKCVWSTVHTFPGEVSFFDEFLPWHKVGLNIRIFHGGLVNEGALDVLIVAFRTQTTGIIVLNLMKTNFILSNALAADFKSLRQN